MLFIGASAYCFFCERKLSNDVSLSPFSSMIDDMYIFVVDDGLNNRPFNGKIYSVSGKRWGVSKG